MRQFFISRVLALLSSASLLTPVVAGELDGSAWRLLNIASMDDTVLMPDDPAKYTLLFGADGAASMLADCNRGNATWTSKGAGQLEFGPVATTRAMCPPESLSDKYLAQFEWVRSYLTKDGHLFLATMADGSIIEFEPLPPVVATVLGEEIRSNDASETQSAILTRLFDRYAAERGIKVEEAELNAYLEDMRRGMAAEGLTADADISPEEKLQVNAMRRDTGAALIRQWKINKSLYATYGGRIIYQQLGPEPLDAYRLYLQERQKAGDFRINEPAMADAFWQYFTDDSKHDFMEKGSADEARAFVTPPWEQQGS